MNKNKVIPVVSYFLFIVICAAFVGYKYYSDGEIEKEQAAAVMKNKQQEIAKMSSLVNNDDSRLYELVNKNNKLDKNYIPNDLVYPSVKTVIKGKDNRNLLRRNAADALEDMFNAAKQDGIELYFHSGFRSYGTQSVIYKAHDKSDEEEPLGYVAKPGESEHQTGFAADISSKEVKYKLDDTFESSKAGKWLKNNAYKYGFILRYPKDKENITGYKYEPWHYRFVGKELAKYLHEDNITMEEFYKKIN